MTANNSPRVPRSTMEGVETSYKIELLGLHKAFSGKEVLRGIDLRVAAGDAVVILGGSGTGKSVLLRHVIGLLRPDRGSVLVDGTDLAELGRRELTEFRRRFGMSFQEGALFDSMTVFENVAFPLRRSPTWNRGEIADRVMTCLSLVRLEGAEHKVPAELSGGMRRRVGFARAIALEPEILLFDEPNTGLDPVTAAVIDELIVRMGEELNSTSITITHALESAYRISNRIVMLHAGRIIADAPPEEFRRLEDPRVQQFVKGLPRGPLSDGSES